MAARLTNPAEITNQEKQKKQTIMLDESGHECGRFN